MSTLQAKSFEIMIEMQIYKNEMMLIKARYAGHADLVAYIEQNLKHLNEMQSIVNHITEVSSEKVAG